MPTYWELNPIKNGNKLHRNKQHVGDEGNFLSEYVESMKVAVDNADEFQHDTNMDMLLDLSKVGKGGSD